MSENDTPFRHGELACFHPLKGLRRLCCSKHYQNFAYYRCDLFNHFYVIYQHLHHYCYRHHHLSFDYLYFHHLSYCHFLHHQGLFGPRHHRPLPRHLIGRRHHHLLVSLSLTYWLPPRRIHPRTRYPKSHRRRSEDPRRPRNCTRCPPGCTRRALPEVVLSQKGSACSC